MLLTITTLIMPYSNYEDGKSVIALYNNNLNADADMNFAEFIGEKLIASGIQFDEEEDEPKQSNNTPINHNEIIQIQNGVIFHKQETPIEFTSYKPVIDLGPSFNVKVSKEDYRSGIFRPPTA